jgi:hypothetical protein
MDFGTSRYEYKYNDTRDRQYQHRPLPRFQSHKATRIFKYSAAGNNFVGWVGFI